MFQAFQPRLKYSWQRPLVDALIENDSERLPEKITNAERAVSARLIENPADPEEQLALRGAVITLECARNAAVGRF